MQVIQYFIQGSLVSCQIFSDAWSAVTSDIHALSGDLAEPLTILSVWWNSKDW